jgi:hypothetical protein
MSRNEKIRAFVIDAQDTERMLEDFSDEEAGKILKGLLAYANRGEEFETEDRAMRCLFKNIQANIDRNYDKYEAKCERNRQIAKAREQKRKEAREKIEERAEREPKAPKSTNVHERKQASPKTPNENEIEITNIKVIKEAKASIIKAPKGATSETSSDAASAPAQEAKNEASQTQKESKIDFEKVRQQFNRLMEKKKIPSLKGKIAGQRRAFFEARVREYGITAAYRGMIKAARSGFLNGSGGRAWVANFEWIFRPNNFPKVLDGYYDNPQPQVPTSTATIGGYNNGTETPTASGRTINRNEQRATEQRERIQGYAGIASKWRQTADGDATAMGHEE